MSLVLRDSSVRRIPLSARSASSGYQHTVLRSDCGRMFAFGNDLCCQTGVKAPFSVRGLLRPKDDVEEPAEIKWFTENDVAVRHLSSGSFHNAVVSLRGNVYCWGSVHLGTGNTWNDATPQRVDLSNEKAEQLVCGPVGTLCRTAEGSWWFWGTLPGGCTFTTPVRLALDIEGIFLGRDQIYFYKNSCLYRTGDAQSVDPSKPQDTKSLRLGNSADAAGLFLPDGLSSFRVPFSFRKFLATRSAAFFLTESEIRSYAFGGSGWSSIAGAFSDIALQQDLLLALSREGVEFISPYSHSTLALAHHNAFLTASKSAILLYGNGQG